MYLRRIERLCFEVPSDLTRKFREFQAYGNGQFNLIGTASALNPSFAVGILDVGASRFDDRVARGER